MSNVDRDWVSRMTGPEQAEFRAAMLAAFPGHEGWRMLLSDFLDRNLAEYASDAIDLVETGRRVITAAKTDGWLPDLVEAALTAKSRNPSLRAWAAAHRSAAPDRQAGAGADAWPLPAAVAGPAGDPPVVFVSYAHASDNDELFGLFADDLRDAIVAATALPREQALYVDTQLAGGARWSPRLVAALAGCRVLMPFLAPGLFASRGCGREWAYFDDRQAAARAATGHAVESIVPVLWHNPANYTDRLHTPPVSPVQYEPNGAEYKRYRERGLRALYNQPAAYAADTRAIREWLADQVAKILRGPALPAGPTGVDFDAIVPAFGE